MEVEVAMEEAYSIFGDTQWGHASSCSSVQLRSSCQLTQQKFYILVMGPTACGGEGPVTVSGGMKAVSRVYVPEALLTASGVVGGLWRPPPQGMSISGSLRGPNVRCFCLHHDASACISDLTDGLLLPETAK
ncbi:hypothetical protein Vafri_1499 [Volvox africanus]|nr:hypothetical protein Vafri_1499 [Volvox africanus]